MEDCTVEKRAKGGIVVDCVGDCTYIPWDSNSLDFRLLQKKRKKKKKNRTGLEGQQTKTTPLVNHDPESLLGQKVWMSRNAPQANDTETSFQILPTPSFRDNLFPALLIGLLGLVVSPLLLICEKLCNQGQDERAGEDQIHRPKRVNVSIDLFINSGLGQGCNEKEQVCGGGDKEEKDILEPGDKQERKELPLDWVRDGSADVGPSVIFMAPLVTSLAPVVKRESG